MAFPEFYLALQPKHFVLPVIFYSIYETHSTCPLFISSWCLKGNGIKPWGQYGFVWQKKNHWGTCSNISLAFCFEELQSEILPSGQKGKKKFSQCYVKKFQPLAPGNHSLSNPLSQGDIFPCFPSTVRVYRLGRSADTVVCYVHTVVCSGCLWGAWGLFPAIQATLFYVLWTCTCRKLFHNNSRQSSERSFSCQIIVGKIEKKNKSKTDKQTSCKNNSRYSDTFPFYQILSSANK